MPDFRLFRLEFLYNFLYFFRTTLRTFAIIFVQLIDLVHVREECERTFLTNAMNFMQATVGGKTFGKFFF